jgi:hypothetical protein
MIQRDYLMRMINMMITMLLRLVGFKEAKEYPKAILEIQTTGKALLGMDWDLVQAFSVSQMMQLFGSDLSVAVPKAYIVAVLLKEEAEIRGLMSGDEASMPLYEKSLDLLLETYLQFNEPVEERHQEFTDDVLAVIRRRSLPVDLLRKIFAYEDLLGRYANAEDALFRIISVEPEFAADGIRFYERLLKRSREELSTGGLPREEVLDGLAELKSRSG